MSLIKCPKCGTEMPNTIQICTNCSCPLDAKPIKETKKRNGFSKFILTHKVISIIVAVVILFCAIGLPIIISSNSSTPVNSLNDNSGLDDNSGLIEDPKPVDDFVLTGKDLVAYNLILKGAYEFKDPTSVRVVSGCLGVDQDCGWFIISAINSFGGRASRPYFFCEHKTLGFFVLESDEENSFHKKTDDFSIEKVNKALNKHWENLNL